MSAPARPPDTAPRPEPDRYGTQEHFDSLWDFLTDWHRRGPDFHPAVRTQIPVETWGFPPLQQAVLDAQARGCTTSHIIGPTRNHVFPDWFRRRLLELECKTPPPPWNVTRTDFPHLYASPTTRTPTIGGYRILSLAGKGGMAAVFKAFDPTEAKGKRRLLAVKVLTPDSAVPDAKRRFRREVAKMQGLPHPNIIQILQAPEPVGPEYLVMEYVYGPTLQDLIRHHTDRPIPLALAVDLLRQVALGLQYIQSENDTLVHRDLKPTNILLTRKRSRGLTPHGWQAKIADFGLAFDADDPRITEPGGTAGTPLYMAPEQALQPREGGQITPAADVFSLGVIGYELLTGVHPFHDETHARRIARLLKGIKTIDPKKWNPDLPPGLQSLIVKMMSRDPDNRWPVAEVVEKLGTIRRHLRRTETRTGAAGVRTRSSSARPGASAGSHAPVRKKKADLDEAYGNYRDKVLADFVFYEGPPTAPVDPQSPLPFLRTQPLYALKPGVDPKGALNPERFRAAGRDEQDRSDRSTGPNADDWEELDREALVTSLAGPAPGQRIAITTDAGLGKSRNLAWLHREYLARGRGWAFALNAGDPIGLGDLVPDWLAPQVTAANNSGINKTQLVAALDAARAAGTITLVVDGLDQSDEVGWLQDLLHPRSGWGACHVVVAGRPFALEGYWDRFFARRPWRYVLIAEIDPTQQQQLLGAARYDAIPKDARALLSTPRVLQYVRQLAADELPHLRTASDVYWRAVRHMLAEALTGEQNLALTARVEPPTVREITDCMALLAALAFTMYARTIEIEGPERLSPNLNRIPAADMPGFLDATAERLGTAVPRYSDATFESRLQRLVRLNAFHNGGWLDGRAIGRATDLLWRNASLQEFLAAYWVSRWGEADAAALRDWVVDPHSGKNRGFYWLWRYAAEMPDAVIRPDARKPPTRAWVTAMTPLYISPPDKDGLPIRSTEFLYRSWDRPGDPLGHSEEGRAVRGQFQAEFQNILNKTESEEQAVAIAMTTTGAFIPLACSGQDDDRGTFRMGPTGGEDGAYDDETPAHLVTLSAFALHRFCVRNVEYELFDPWHRKVRWVDDVPHPLVKTDGNRADDDCPVVNVSWYDAWCFARWVGCIQVDPNGPRYEVCLPSEAQWEYACRAGRDTAFTFDESHPGASVTPDVCNFDGNHLWPEGTTLPRMAEADVYRGRTIPVAALGPNRWGLYQLHGNVWEWCTDWYWPDFYHSEEGVSRNPVATTPASARVLRGGSWYFTGGFCRSASRNRDAPGVRFRNRGFRLAAVPVVGAESGV